MNPLSWLGTRRQALDSEQQARLADAQPHVHRVHRAGDVLHAVVDRHGLFRAESGVKAGGGDPELLQGIDLVLHQGQERTHDQGHAFQHDRG